MSNSPLTSHTKISPNKGNYDNKGNFIGNNRTSKISKITIHHMAGNLTVESCGAMFAKSSRGASSNYGIGSDGRIALYVDEEHRAWTSSSPPNDNKAITIEVANDAGAPNWHISDKALGALINLCVDICERNNIPKLNFTGDANGNLTQHNYFAATACPGPYLKSKFPYIAEEVNKRLKKNEKPIVPESNGLQATNLKTLSETDVITKIGTLFTEDHRASGILASVSMAQFILESGYGKSELAQNANNCFGMKTSLSGNTWTDSVWDGSKYTKNTQEFENGQYITITADFRKYSCIEKSIADHSAYLNGAMNGSSPRYLGLKGCNDYRKAFEIIKGGGYATSPDYVEKLCAVVEKWNLTRFDLNESIPSPPNETPTYPPTPFMISVIVPDLNYRSKPSMEGEVKGQTGKGVFTIVKVENGWGRLKSEVGWIWLGNNSYCTIQSATTKPENTVPYQIRVDINNLNIRNGPGTEHEITKQTGRGVFTITEEIDGQGSVKGWGKLKSGAGWVSLDHVMRIN